MPNGGVPRHMVLATATEPPAVLHCEGSTLRVFAKADWDEYKGNATPLAVLTADEALVLERFLRYWLPENQEGPIYHRSGVQVAYDF